MGPIKTYKTWKQNTELSDGTFLKAYLYSRMVVNPRRRKKTIIEKVKEIWLG